MRQNMKATISILLLILAAAFVAGCDDNNNGTNPIIADVTPQPPQGVFSITRDNGVELWWAGVYETDIDEYWVYRATSPDSIAPANYDYQFAVTADPNPNLNLIYYHVLDDGADNGTTYWYAIASVDKAGHVSDLSAEDVWDTPRPEGVVTMDAILDYGNPADIAAAGFSIADTNRVSAASSQCDVYVDYVGGLFYLNTGDTASTRGTEIQDMGYTYDWDAIGYAPTTGWLETPWAEIVLNHTYVIRTDDLHYVKMRAIELNDVDGFVRFQWAYQLQEGNPELVSPDGAVAMTTDQPKVSKLNYVSSK